MRLVFATLLTFLLINCILSQNVVINEFMSDNESTIVDEDGDYSDWIEIYNPTDEDLNLAGYHISDSYSNINKWTFPNLIIPSKGFIVIFASGKNRLNPDEIHTNFSISKDGEPLVLSKPNLETINIISPIELYEDESYGRIPDGGHNMGKLDLPTPGSTNSESYTILCSHNSGFFSSTFNVTLTPSNSDCNIYYTTNGSLPSINSKLYTEPIEIKNNNNLEPNISLIPTTPLEGPYQLYSFIWKVPESVYCTNVLRFAAFKNDTIKSNVYSRTYFVDPHINERYTFPIISIITDSLNLFDYDTGIYVPGYYFDSLGFNWWPIGNYHNKGVDWEREAHLCYFENVGTLGFETDIGIRMRGFGSTSNPQKSFNLYFRSSYGKNKIEYPVFSSTSDDEFKRLILRNSGNDFLKTHFRDAVLQELLSSLDMELQQFKPSVVFINGEYWGIHNIREKYDEDYFKYNYGIDEDNLNILTVCGGIEHGNNIDYINLINFISSNNMSLEENYNYVKTKIDILNFIDYQIAEIYYANYDWPCNNQKIWKTNNTNSKWRWLITDLDLSFAYDYHSLYNSPSLYHAASEEESWPYCKCSNFILRKLLLNNEFRDDFLNRFLFHLKNTFNYTRVVNRIKDFEDLFLPEMEEHIARWGYPKDLNTWYDEIDIMIEFAEKRPCYMPINIMDFFNISSFDFDCEYYSNIEITDLITLAPNPNAGQFNIINISKTELAGNIKITDISGKVIYQLDNITINPEERVYLNLDFLSSNTYILMFNGADVLIYKKLVIIK
jgi:hypothetical protein